MYCKRCGMDSENTEVCEWCKQPMMAVAPQQPGAVPEQDGFAPEIEPEVEPEVAYEDSAVDDEAAYIADEEPGPKVAVPAEEGPSMSTGARLGICLGASTVLGIVFLLLAHLITKETPTHLYAGYLRIPGEGIGTTLISGILFGLILGVLVGGLLCLTHLGPAAGFGIGLILGYVVLNQPGFPVFSAICGGIIGIICGIVCNIGYKRIVTV